MRFPAMLIRDTKRGIDSRSKKHSRVFQTYCIYIKCCKV